MATGGIRLAGYEHQSCGWQRPTPGLFFWPDLQREQIAAVPKREGFRVVEILEEYDASGGEDRGSALQVGALQHAGYIKVLSDTERGEHDEHRTGGT